MNGFLCKIKKLDVADSFCYLGDTIGAGGGCDLSVITRIRSAWGKFQEQTLQAMKGRSRKQNGVEKETQNKHRSCATHFKWN